MNGSAVCYHIGGFHVNWLLLRRSYFQFSKYSVLDLMGYDKFYGILDNIALSTNHVSKYVCFNVRKIV